MRTALLVDISATQPGETEAGDRARVMRTHNLPLRLQDVPDVYEDDEDEDEDFDEDKDDESHDDEDDDDDEEEEETWQVLA